MRVLVVMIAVLTGCVAVELEAEEPTDPCCSEPADFPTDPELAARWERAGQAMIAHAHELGRIFDRVCPDFDLECLGELDRQLRPLAARTRALRKELGELLGQRCGYFAEAYDLVEPGEPARLLLVRLLRAGGNGTTVIWDALPFIAGIGGSRGCCTLGPAQSAAP